MKEKRVVEQFLELDKTHSRLESLCTLLQNNDTYYYIERSYSSNNVIVPLSRTAGKYEILVAHYDIVPGSTGINDNTCAVAMLIEVAKALQFKTDKAVKIVFTDKEETGMIGAYDYDEAHYHELKSATVFDIIGYGNIYVYGSGEGSFPDLEKRGIKRIKTVLPSDNIMFGTSTKTALITAIHKEDVDGDDIIFKPRFYESFHGRIKDNDISIINFKLILSLRKELIELYGKRGITEEGTKDIKETRGSTSIQ